MMKEKFEKSYDILQTMYPKLNIKRFLGLNGYIPEEEEMYKSD